MSKNTAIGPKNCSLRAHSIELLLIRLCPQHISFGFLVGANWFQEASNTFHLGFWFDKPEDAAALSTCHFDPTKPTPFNGEHKAGPFAMISVPDSKSGLGPLCISPNNSTTPASCSAN
jgi:hypothetical protein